MIMPISYKHQSGKCLDCRASQNCHAKIIFRKQIERGLTHLWDPVPCKKYIVFIGSNIGHHKFQRLELGDPMSEEAQKIWAKTQNLHVKRSKCYELVSSSFWSCNNRSHLVVRKT